MIKMLPFVRTPEKGVFVMRALQNFMFEAKNDLQVLKLSILSFIRRSF